MEFAFATDEAHQVLIVKTSGRPDLDGFCRLSAAIVQEIHATGHRRILIDNTSLEDGFTDLTSEDVKTYARLQKRYREELATLRIAGVAGSTLQYGLARMWQALVELEGIELLHRVFNGREEAWYWLLSDVD